jgi:hypothetical protein
MDDLSRLSLLGRRLPPLFDVRTVDIAPAAMRAYDAGEWRDALVVVERGEVELESLHGSLRSFGRGSILWLADLPLRALHNRGPDHALLVAVTRR